MSEQAVEIVTRVEAAGVPRAGQVLELARWAGRAFSSYDLASVRLVCAAVESTAIGPAGATSSVTAGAARSLPDLVSPRIDVAAGGDAGVVLVPRPIGPVVVVAPSSGATTWVHEAVSAALAGRNAVVVVPHPLAPQQILPMVRALAQAAVSVGAPEGLVQVVEHTSAAVADAVTTDPRAALILAAPSGRVPVLVDATADLPAVARHLVEGVGVGSPAARRVVLVVEETVADALVAAMVSQGAPQPVLLQSVVGIEQADNEPVDIEVPVMVRASGAGRALRAAAAVLRIDGGDTVVVHSGEPAAVLAVAAALTVSHVVVNDVLGSAPWVDPGRLVTWTRVRVAQAGASSTAAAMTAYEREGVSPWRAPGGPVPPYPVASNADGVGR